MGFGRTGWGMAYTPVLRTDAAARRETRCDLVDILSEIECKSGWKEVIHLGNSRSWSLILLEETDVGDEKVCWSCL